MNIFVLDKSPIIAAQMACDKHVVKMILESAQMLSTAHRVLDGVCEKRKSKSGKRIVDYWKHIDHKLESTLYKAVHINHPCSVWCRKSIENYNWLYKHFAALSKEYEQRYGRKHATYCKLVRILASPPDNIPKGGLTEFPLCMPDYCKSNSDTDSYRTYYIFEKSEFATWKYSDTPKWWIWIDPERLKNETFRNGTISSISS